MGHALILGRGLYSNYAPDLDAVRIANFKRQITTGRGELPEKIFYEDPTYEFEPWKAFKGSASYEDDLKILKNLIISTRSNIYIKDISFLGFPSYYVYITGRSSLLAHPESFKEIYSVSSTINPRRIYSNLACSSEEDIRSLIRYIELIISSPEIPEDEKPIRWLSMIFESKISAECIMAPEHMLALLYFKLGDYAESCKKMDDLFKKYNLDRREFNHLFAFRDALFLMSKMYEIYKIENILSNYYHKTSVLTVMTMLSIPDINFVGIKVPKPSDYSRYDDCISIFEKMRNKVEASSIDQYKLKEYFY
jgi:ribosomal protein S12 methylthiotransferase accessory factor